ncbi:hypothetical protein DFH11DRAFT_1632076 [Phellopilus nigrolimitatus]|nr:hypothetical protein DFH11DRAFT_1632076 [Phellopilus nigrolimitatus]
MASQKQLQRGYIYVIFGLKTPEFYTEMGILVTLNDGNFLFPCFKLIGLNGRVTYITNIILSVSIKSAEFQNAIQLNEKPRYLSSGAVNPSAALEKPSEEEWLEFHLKDLNEWFDRSLEAHAKTILDFGKNEKTGLVIRVSNLLNTHNVFLSQALDPWKG